MISNNNDDSDKEKLMRFMNLHHIFPNKSKILTIDTFYWPKLVNVIVSFLKTFTYLIFQKICKKIKIQKLCFESMDNFF